MSRQAIDKILAGSCTLVVENGGEVHTFSGRGVRDLSELLEHSPQLLAGADVTDKVVGKGAAALMVLGRVGRVYALVISEAAMSLLERSGVEVTYGRLEPYIINRSGSGVCPVEELCRDCLTAEECLPLIRGFLQGK